MWKLKFNLKAYLSTAALPVQTTKTALTEEFMFQNVAYRPTVYITGIPYSVVTFKGSLAFPLVHFPFFRRSCRIRSVEIGVKYWNCRWILKLSSILNLCFLFNFHLKQIRSKRSKNHSYWALKIYLFELKHLYSLKVPQNAIFGRSFFSWKLKENKDSKFDKNFNIRRKFQHLQYNIIRAFISSQRKLCNGWNTSI